MSEGARAGARHLVPLVVVLLVVGLASALAAPSGDGHVAARGQGSFDHSYSSWDAVLRSSVSRGRVDYKAVARDSRLGRFLKKVGEVSAEEVASWSRPEQVAFYVNVYNALTFQTVVEALPLESVRDIDPNPWEQDRWLVAGKTMSLDEIEHKKLRKDLREPRIHFVLAAATRSAPSSPGRALLPSNLGDQLDRAARAFFRDESKNRIDRERELVQLSPILHWYGKDFLKWEGLATFPEETGLAAREDAVIRTMAGFVSRDDREFLESGSFTVVYNEYDWSLNDR